MFKNNQKRQSKKIKVFLKLKILREKESLNILKITKNLNSKNKKKQHRKSKEFMK